MIYICANLYVLKYGRRRPLPIYTIIRQRRRRGPMRRDQVVIYIYIRRRARPIDRHISPPPRRSLVSRVSYSHIYTYQFLRLFKEYIIYIYCCLHHMRYEISSSPRGRRFNERKENRRGTPRARYPSDAILVATQHIKIIFNIIYICIKRCSGPTPHDDRNRILYIIQRTHRI